MLQDGPDVPKLKIPEHSYFKEYAEKSTPRFLGRSVDTGVPYVQDDSDRKELRKTKDGQYLLADIPPIPRSARRTEGLLHAHSATARRKLCPRGQSGGVS
jgi:hypothetical protein